MLVQKRLASVGKAQSLLYLFNVSDCDDWANFAATRLELRKPLKFQFPVSLKLSLEDRIMAAVQKTTDSSSLAEVVDRILDKGIVIDIWAKVSLVGIELLSIEARIVIASVETYLKYAEAIGLTATAAAPA
jgi:hypothetical protein